MKELTFEYKIIKAVCLAALIIPTIMFFLGWIKPIISIPLTLMLLGSYVFALIKDDDRRQIKVGLNELIFILIVVTLWCVLTGIGGVTASKADLYWRNPIYADIIFKEWPVRYYEEFNGYGFSYYIGYWLVPGAISKIFTFLGQDIAWNVGRIALIIWTAFLLCLCSLLLKVYTKAKGFKSTVIMMLLFVFFSDMDIISLGIQTAFNNLQEVFFVKLRHFEHLTCCWQFSSMSTQLAWAFNQSVPAWLASLLFINEKTAKSYALIGLSIMITSPLPLVGLGALMMTFAARDLFKSMKDGTLRSGIRQILSPTNILAAISIFPPVAMYYSSNGSGGNMELGLSYAAIHWKSYLAFMIGCHIVTTLVLLKKDHIFECVLLLCSFCIFPIIFIGQSALDIKKYPLDIATNSDFCMRATIPAIVILMAMVARYFFGSKNKKDLRVVLLTIIMALGLLAPMAEMISSIEGAINPERAYFYPYSRSLMTLEDMDPYLVFNTDTETNSIREESNFICITEESNFYKYLAR